MLRFAADENFNRLIVRGALARNPRLDIRRVQEANLAGADDPTVLAWAAREGRVLLTHDFETMLGFVYARVAVGLPMPGAFAVHWQARHGPVIEDLLMAAEASLPGEWESRVGYLPF